MKIFRDQGYDPNFGALIDERVVRQFEFSAWSILAIHFDKHVTINITQRLHDPTLCLATLFLIEVRRRFVRFDRHADHKPFGYFALSEQSGKYRNSGY
jgi:hypothetical protein